MTELTKILDDIADRALNGEITLCELRSTWEWVLREWDNFVLDEENNEQTLETVIETFQAVEYFIEHEGHKEVVIHDENSELFRQ